MNPVRSAFLLGLALAALTAAADGSPEPESQRLARELRALIGEARCTSDSQCRSLPVGAKACGGPAGYWAWSTQGTDAAAVAELARRQADAERREVEASGLRSNCQVTPDPGVSCQANRCRPLTPPSRGGA